MSLKTSVLAEIKTNKDLIRKLEDFHQRSFYTIQDWIKHDNPMLSNYESLIIISQYLNISIENLINKSEKTISK